MTESVGPLIIECDIFEFFRDYGFGREVDYYNQDHEETPQTQQFRTFYYIDVQLVFPW